MKIELTIQELLEIIDMIKYGENNEGNDFYLMQDFLDGKDDPKSKKKWKHRFKSWWMSS